MCWCRTMPAAYILLFFSFSTVCAKCHVSVAISTNPSIQPWAEPICLSIYSNYGSECLRIRSIAVYCLFFFCLCGCQRWLRCTAGGHTNTLFSWSIIHFVPLDHAFVRSGETTVATRHNTTNTLHSVQCTRYTYTVNWFLNDRFDANQRD